MTEQLQKKIDQAIRLIKSAGADGSIVEVAYSGGKDSDVILQLTKESGIKYRAIYKMTTIDPSGTIQHAKKKGVEIVKPKENFFQLVARKGLPSRRVRFCCEKLKEYKILDKCIIGVRKAESVRRAKSYKEPTECKFYGNKKEHVEVFYPILDWSDDNVQQFIEDRQIECAPIYYRGGAFDVKKRLGCMCCPLLCRKKRIEEFKSYPNMLKAYVKYADIWRQSHQHTLTFKRYDSVYEWIARDILFIRQSEFDEDRNSIFGKPDYKKLLEDTFNVKFDK